MMTLIHIAVYVGRNDDEIHDTYFYYEKWNEII